MHKNIVSNNLKEFVLGLEAAVKEGYSVVEESVAFESGFWKVLTKQDRLVAQVEMPAVSGVITEFGEVVEIPEGTEMEISAGVVVTQKPKRNRK